MMAFPSSRGAIRDSRRRGPMRARELLSRPRVAASRNVAVFGARLVRLGAQLARCDSFELNLLILTVRRQRTRSMNRTFIHLLVVAPLFLLASCQDNAARARVQKAEADIEGLRTGMRYLAQQLPTTRRAVLDPTSKGYAFVDTGAGRLLVSCDSAIQYLDGQKVTLRVGNPFNMSFNGFKLTVRFGPRPPVYPASEGVTDSSGSDFASWQSSYATREKALKQQEIPFTESLPSGAWTKIDMVLSPSKPEEIGYIDLQMAIDQVALRKPSF